MWVKRSEMLALVAECGETKTTKKNKVKKMPWKWDPIHQAAFDCVKATIAKEVVLAYPDFSKPFEIYTDASTLQLGAVITQDNRPIAFFSRKLSETQTRWRLLLEEYAPEIVCVCVLTRSPVRGGFAKNAISIAGQVPPPPRGCSY